MHVEKIVIKIASYVTFHQVAFQLLFPGPGFDQITQENINFYKILYNNG